MKNRNIAVVTLIMAACFVASAQTVDDLKAQLATLDQQIDALRQQLYQSPDYQQLQQTAATATKAYEDALSSDPTISDLNKQLVALQQQMQTIIKQKIDQENQLASTTLAAQKGAKDQAEQNLLNARTGGALGAALQQHHDLAAQLSQAEITH